MRKKKNTKTVHFKLVVSKYETLNHIKVIEPAVPSFRQQVGSVLQKCAVQVVWLVVQLK